MVDKKQLEEVYKQNLENDIIDTLSKMKGIDLRKAFDIYYSSKLAEQISNDSYGIENMDAKYLADSLRRTYHPKDVVIGYVGPVIGSHSGPGTLALFFLGSQR